MLRKVNSVAEFLAKEAVNLEDLADSLRVISNPAMETLELLEFDGKGRKFYRLVKDCVS